MSSSSHDKKTRRKDEKNLPLISYTGTTNNSTEHIYDSAKKLPMKCLVIFFNKPITELQYKILKKSSCAKIQLSFSVPFPYVFLMKISLRVVLFFTLFGWSFPHLNFALTENGSWKKEKKQATPVFASDCHSLLFSVRTVEVFSNLTVHFFCKQAEELGKTPRTRN